MPRKELVRGGISILGGLAIWEILARLLLENELLIPPPSSVARSFWHLTLSGQLNKHFTATLIEFAYGFSTACIVGVVIGYFMGMYKRFDEIMDPWIATLYSIPIITVVPLIIIWFGIGMMSKVIVVFKITAVAIILNTAAGIKNLDPVWLELAKSLRLINSYYGMRVVNREYVELARSFRLRPWALFVKILLPASIPFILAGIRLAIDLGSPASPSPNGSAPPRGSAT